MGEVTERESRLPQTGTLSIWGWSTLFKGTLAMLSIGVLAPAHLSNDGLQLGVAPRTLCRSAQSPTDWATSACLRTTIWNSYTTKLRPFVATLAEHRDYNSNNTTVASAPWTAVHVKQNYNAHETCLLLFTSCSGTHTAVSFSEINRDFREKKTKNQQLPCMKNRQQCSKYKRISLRLNNTGLTVQVL